MQGLDVDEVRKCTFSLLCTKTWRGLSRIDGQPKVRFCGECQEVVHLCTTAAQVREHARQRHCVAIKPRDGGRMLVGDVIFPE